MPRAASDAIDNGPVVCAEPDQRGAPRPSGRACDSGAVEFSVPTSSYPLCVYRYSRYVLSPLEGQCSVPGHVELVVPYHLPLTFCVERFTGVLRYRFGEPCSSPRLTHALPGNGDLLTCVDDYSGVNRWVLGHFLCRSTETPNTIPDA
jgi:hypothetical protein